MVTHYSLPDAALRITAADLTRTAEQVLTARYGMTLSPRDGYCYHNKDHGHDVAMAAGQLANELHEAGRVDHDVVTLAPLAGWWHDASQGPRHEARSADEVARLMQQHGVPSRHIVTVSAMIAATRVTGVDGHRLIQAADPTDPRQALLADADLSSLGKRDGVYRALQLHVEQQHVAGHLTLPDWAQAEQVEPDREATLSFLTFQAGLFREHCYLLDVSRRLYPEQGASADLIQWLHDLYAADRISWAGLVAQGRRHAFNGR